MLLVCVAVVAVVFAAAAAPRIQAIVLSCLENDYSMFVSLVYIVTLC